MEHSLIKTMTSCTEENQRKSSLPPTFLLEDGLLSPEHDRCTIKSGMLCLPLRIAFLGKVLPLLHHS